MEENNTIYLNYGDEQIAQNDFLKTAADLVNTYVLSLPWSKKRKELFMKYYTDIMQKNITGASNTSGLWQINYEGELIPLESLPKKDQEMIGEVGYFIQQLMNGLATTAKANREAEEKKKAVLPLFNNEYFTTLFNGHIGNNLFGGQNWDIQKWNNQDAANEDGIRGTRNRALKLAEHLRSYRNSLKEGEHNFEGSPFANLDDFKTRLSTAIAALESEDPNDDADALNRIGLNPDTYLSTGANDIITYGDKEMTRADAIVAREKATQEAEKLKQQLLAELQKAKLKTAYNNTLFLTRGSSKLLGKTGVELKTKYGDDTKLIEALNNYSQNNLRNLTPDELSEIHGAYRYLANSPIDELTLKNLQNSSSGLYKGAAPNRFKKIKGVDGFVWDNVAKQVIQILTRQLTQNVPEKSLFDEVKTSQEIQNSPISKEGWTSADSADVASMIGDVISLGGFGANIAGTALSLGADVYSDLERGKNGWDIAKGVGANLGWGLVGMLPGAKSAKIATRAARLVPKAIMLVQSAGIVLDPEVQQSALKFTKPSEYKNISSKDLENLKYLFHAVSGGTNIAKSHYRAKNYRERINKTEVSTADGSKVKLSRKQVKEINEVGRKQGQKAAETKFKEITGKDAAEGSFKFNENGRKWYNPAKYSSHIASTVTSDQKLSGVLATDLREMSRILLEDKKRPWYNWNKGYAKWDLGVPFRTSKTTNSKPENITTTNQTFTPESAEFAKDPKINSSLLHNDAGVKNPTPINYNRETINRYKDMMTGKFGTEKLQSGSSNLGGSPLNIVKQSDGTFSVIFKENIIANERNLIELLKAVRNLILQHVKPTSSSTTKISPKDLGKVLREYKAKGWLKQGGTINRLKITKYKNYIKK